MDKTKLKNLLLSVITAFSAVAVCLLVVEMYLRILDPMKLRALREGKDIPESRSPFREPFPTAAKADKEVRIVALGDSYTWGDGLADNADTWTSVLERDLKLELNKNIDVINMGMRGLTTFNEYELFIKAGQKFSPDLVIIQYLINDVLPSGPDLRRVGEDWMSKSLRKNLIANERIHNSLGRLSYLYSFVNDRYLTLQRKNAKSLTWHDLYKDDFSGFIMQKNAIKAFGYWSAQNKIKVLFVLFPTFPSGTYTTDNYPNADIYKKVEDIARQNGLEVLNLIPVFTEKGGDMGRFSISPADGHPNKEAAGIAAGAIKDHIEKNKFIK